jgi:Flp pilus assembly secretin CpaC
MVVTAHLVKPLTPAEVPPIPGEDEFNDPNDFELFLLGIIESNRDEPREKKDADVNISERQFSKRDLLIDISPGKDTPSTQKNHSLTQTPEQPGSPAGAPAPSPQNDKPSTLEGPLGPLGFVRS